MEDPQGPSWALRGTQDNEAERVGTLPFHKGKTQTGLGLEGERPKSPAPGVWRGQSSLWKLPQKEREFKNQQDQTL